MKTGFGSPLINQSLIVSPTVFVWKTFEKSTRIAIDGLKPTRKLIGKSQNQNHEGVFILWIYVKDIQADTLGFEWFVQKAIPVRFFKCFRNGFASKFP